MVPDRLLHILRSCSSDTTARFPPTEVFNEGWMLRLVLDAAERLHLADHPLSFLQGSQWYSEALLLSPFRPRMRPDPLGEGFTNADAVIGHFTFDHATKAGLRLDPDAAQFVVIEAKMFSNLSKGTKNAPLYDQAARNVACMAEAIANSGRSIGDFESVGFFVLAPAKEKRRNSSSNLEVCVSADSIRAAVANRLLSYETANRTEPRELRVWEQRFLLPLVERLVETNRLGVLTWEECIGAIAERDQAMGAELVAFYTQCLTHAPRIARDAAGGATAIDTVRVWGGEC